MNIIEAMKEVQHGGSVIPICFEWYEGYKYVTGLGASDKLYVAIENDTQDGRPYRLELYSPTFWDYQAQWTTYGGDIE